MFISTKALLAGAALLSTSAGCGTKAPDAVKPIPPTPTVDQFQGVTSEAPPKNSPSSTNQG